MAYFLVISIKNETFAAKPNICIYFYVVVMVVGRFDPQVTVVMLSPGGGTGASRHRPA